mgnify:CR=1 FL=1
MSWYTIILLSLLVCLVAARLYKFSAGSLKITQVNMISYIFYFDLLIFSYLGSIVILLFNNAEFNNLIDNILGGPKTKLLVWECISYAMIAIAVGMIIANIFFNFNSKEIDAYHAKPIRSLFSEYDSYVKIPLYILAVICMLAITYTFISIGTIPFIKSFFLSSADDVLALRKIADKDFAGNVYVKNFFGLVLTPILCYIFYCYYLIDKSLKNRFWFHIMFFFAFMMLTYDASKSPFISFLTGFIFLKVLISGNISFKKFLGLIVLLLVLLGIIYMVIAKQDIMEIFFSYNSGITGRILISQVSSLYQHFEIFPSDHPFIGFSSLSKVLPLSHFSDRSGRIVLETTTPGFADLGGVYNTLFIGEAYANFGWWGVFLTPLWIGFLIQSLHILFLRLPKTPLFLGLFVFFSFTSNITGGVNEYFYNILYLLLAITILAVWVTAYLLHRSQQVKQIPQAV